jgi:hypothetical protein
LAPRILLSCQNRLPADWQAFFGHTAVRLETFVDPQQLAGTIYKAADRIFAGDTRGFRCTLAGCSTAARPPKIVFVKPLKPNAQALLSRPTLKPAYCIG